MSRGLGLTALVVMCLLPSGPLAAQEPLPTPAPTATPAAPEQKGYRALTTDDEDGRFDVSEMIYSRALLHFLPVPIIVTEPAVGYGGGMGAIVFHQLPDRSSGQLVPPSVSMGAGFLTSDGSWGGGAGHFHSWRGDAWRAQGFVGHASLDLSSAGIAPGLAPDRKVAYTLESTFVLLEGSRRIVPRWRLGLRYVHLGSEVTIGREDSAEAPSLAGDSALGGLGIVVRYDSRDSLLTPRRGQRFDLRPMWYDRVLGSDAEFLRVDSDYTGYWRRDLWGFGLRVDASWADQDAPFYAKPFVQLRGVPSMELLGERVLSSELEIGRDLDARWTVLAFGGAGEAWNDLPQRGLIGHSVYSGGVGFRYLLARILGLRAGLDVATSSDGESAIYMVMGSAWR